MLVKAIFSGFYVLILSLLVMFLTYSYNKPELYEHTYKEMPLISDMSKPIAGVVVGVIVIGFFSALLVLLSVK